MQFIAPFRRLAAIRGARPLLVAFALSRLSIEGMMIFTLVLTALTRFGSPGLAGAVAFLAIAPGMVVSPVAGTLLDRYGRKRFIIIDAAVAALILGAIGFLLDVDRLNAATFLVLAMVLSFTRPLAVTGERAMLPTLVPAHLWDAANSADLVAANFAGVAGPPVAAVVFASAGSPAAYWSCAVLLVLAVTCLSHVPDTAIRVRGTALIGDARRGIAYVLANRILVTTVVSCFLVNITNGAFDVAVPVIIVRHLHLPAWIAGSILALVAVVSVVSLLGFAHVTTDGRERRFMLAGAACAALTAITIAVAAIAMQIAGAVLLGLTSGLYWVPLFGIRQRRTAPAFYARAFAICASFSYLGVPAGALLGGILVGNGSLLTCALICAVTAVAGGLTLLRLPSEASGSARAIPQGDLEGMDEIADTSPS